MNRQRDRQHAYIGTQKSGNYIMFSIKTARFKTSKLDPILMIKKPIRYFPFAAF